MLTKIILVSISALCLAFAHPHCHYDEREVDLEREMTFCSMDYASEGVCCTELEEAALNATYTAVVNGLTTECADYYKQVRLRPTAVVTAVLGSKQEFVLPPYNVS